MRKLKYVVAAIITAVMISTVSVSTAFAEAENSEETSSETTNNNDVGQNAQNGAQQQAEGKNNDAQGLTDPEAPVSNDTAVQNAAADTAAESIPVGEEGAADPEKKNADIKEMIDNLGTGELFGILLTFDIILIVLVIVLTVSLTRLSGKFKKFRKDIIKRDKKMDEMFVTQDARVANVENGIEKLDGSMTRMQTKLNSLSSSLPSYNQSSLAPVQRETTKPEQTVPQQTVPQQPERPKTVDDFFVDFINSKDGTLPDGFKPVNLSMNDGNVREDNSGYSCFIKVENGVSDEVKLYPGRDIKFADFRRYYSAIFDTEGDGKQVYGILPCKAIRNSNGDYEIRSKGRIQF